MLCVLQFAFAHWLFLDAAILSSHYHPPADAPYDSAPVHVSFVDWIPGILSVLGYLIVNLIDKDRIKGEEAYADARAVWRARLILFIGFALMAGGLAGSVVSLLEFCMEKALLTPSYLALDGFGVEVCCASIPGALRVLWIRQRVSERGADAFGCSFMARSERSQRL